MCLDAKRTVGVGKMRHQRHRLHLGQPGQPPVCHPHCIPGEAEPVHAGIDLQVHIERTAQRGVLEHFDLARMVNHRGEVEAVDNIEVAGMEDPFQQENGMQETGLAQAHRLGEIQQGIAVGGTQGARGTRQAVPVCVCLDHRPNPRTRSSGPHHAEVVRQGGSIEFDLNGARHWGCLPAQSVTVR